MSNIITKAKPVVLETGEKKEWFEKWFDSPYYHVLYKDRDHHEAERFLDRLIEFIHPAPQSKILDVACGKGRHSTYLNKKGFDVVGYDLSEESINHNKKFENDLLHFYLHDMRETFRSNYFNIAINLFSSFGYFLKERDNIRCLISHATALKPGGIFIFDYFNCHKIVNMGEAKLLKQIDNIEFQIHKKIIGNIIVKSIDFKDNNQVHHFEEHVRLMNKAELEHYFDIAGFQITHVFGNYELHNFDIYESDRLIIIATKKAH